MKALEAQSLNLGRVFSKNAFASANQVVDPASWRNATNAVEIASRAYRDAASSSGIMTTQQVRANSEVKRYTELLQKQKLSLNDMRKNRDLMKGVYNDQLRMQRMTAQYWGTDQAGRAITDITMPKQVPNELRTWGNRMSMFSAMTKSASMQMVNLGKNTQWAGRQLTVGLSYPITLVGAAAGVMAYQTDAAMQKIAKVYDFSVEAQSNDAQRVKETADLRKASFDLASQAAMEYGSSLKSTLAVEQELAATGLKGQNLTQTTKQVQRVSTLGDIDPEQTTQMIISLQTAFRDTIKDSDDLTNTLNFMNAASNATSLSLQDIAEAVPRAASGFAQLGGTAEQMTVALVSMRESGVDAAEGANALKSASTRIINPVKKATDFYNRFGISLDDLAKKSGGNLFDYLKLLGKEQQKIQGPTQKQTNLMRAQGIAALFGTYQNNRLTASLTNLTDAYGGVDNQTFKAMNLMGQSPTQLAKTAANSMDTVMNSASGRFKKAWAEFTIEISKFGTPFLDIASKVLTVITDIAGVVNSLSEGKKHTLAVASILIAAIGPAIMLKGLIQNLIGQFGRGVGAVTGFAAKVAGGMEIMSAEQAAARLTTEAENAALKEQQASLSTNTKAVSTLAQEIAVLSASYKAAIASTDGWVAANSRVAATAEASAAAVNGAVNASGRVVASEQKKAFAYKTTAEAIEAEVAAMTAAAAAAAKQGKYMPIVPPTSTFVPPKREVYTGTGFMGGRAAWSEPNGAYNQRVAAAQAEHAAIVASRNEQIALNNKVNAENAIRNKVAGRINGAQVSTGLMAASMVGMVGPGNDVSHEIAKWAMIGAIIVPSMIGLVKLTKEFVALSAAAALEQRALAAGVAVTEASAIAATGAFGGMRAGAMGVGVALNEMLGPIGWISLALTAIAGGFMLWKHHADGVAKKQEEIYKKQVESNKMLVDGAKDFANALGNAVGTYDTLLNLGPVGSEAPGQKGMVAKTYAYYSEKNDKGKLEHAKELEPFKGAQTQEELINRLIQRYVDLQKIAGLNSKQALKSLQGMLLVLGKSGKDALDIANQVASAVGSIEDVDWTKILDNSNKIITQNFTDLQNKGGYGSGFTPDSRGFGVAFDKQKEKYKSGLKDMATEIQNSAGLFTTAWNAALNPAQAKAAMESYVTAALQEFSVQYDNMRQNPVLRDLLDKKGINSGQELAAAYDSGNLTRTDLTAANKGKIKGQENYFDPTMLDLGLANARAYEQALISAGSATTGLGEDVKTVDQFTAELVQTGRTLNFKEAVSTSKDYLGNVSSAQAALNQAQVLFGRNSSQALEAQKNLNNTSQTTMDNINSFNASLGYAPGSTPTEAYLNLINRKLIEAKKNANAIPKSVNITITATEAFGAYKDAFGQVREDLADRAKKTLSDQWDSKMQGAQYAQQDASEAFSKAWDKRKAALQKFYDGQEKAIDKVMKKEAAADAARQKMFEAEKERMSRLAELANGQIDFKVAMATGNLDEAAKIQNDISAKQAGWQMDDAEKAAGTAAEKRQAILEKKKNVLEARETRAMKRFEDRQNAAQKAFQRGQDAQMRSMQRTRDYEEEMLDQRLELFKALPAANKKQLKKALDDAGLQLSDFGIKTAGPLADQWGGFFDKSLTRHIKVAGQQIVQDKMWATMGKSISDELVKGFGFDNLQQFAHFAKTGEMKNYSKEKTGSTLGTDHLAQASHHSGGMIGGGGKRTGFTGSKSAQEVSINAQKGEWMMKKAAVNHYGPQFMNDVNEGRFAPGGDTAMGGIGGAGGRFNGGIAALMAGAVSNLFARGLSAGMLKAYHKGQRRAAKAAEPGTFGGSAGIYAGSRMSAEQMKNAATIATVGSRMGMGTRDIEIGIMTALAESSLMNLHGGDRDSQGLFQQRPSQGWGSIKQVTNPEYAAKKFFTALNGITLRAAMDPWDAAQAVQRSGTPDGSNYQRYWETAKNIFQHGLKKNNDKFSAASSAGADGGYVRGDGNAHRPISGPVGNNGLHGGNSAGNPPALDFPGPVGRPVYAIANGVITSSRDIRGPLPSDSYHNAAYGPYGSFGRMITMRTDGGTNALFAHLSRRSVTTGKRVSGGDIIGYSGGSGNSSGPHLHFGALPNPYSWLDKSTKAAGGKGGMGDAKSRVHEVMGGMGFDSPAGASAGNPAPYTFLRNGGELKWDNTMVMGHRKETMLSAPLTQKFKEGVNNFANGNSNDAGITYVTLDLRGATIKDNADVHKAMDEWWRKKNAKMGQSRVIK